MKTKDDIEYTDGMTLYEVRLDSHEGPHFCAFKTTKMKNRSVYVLTDNGWWNIGGARRFYGDKNNAIKEGVSALQDHIDALQDQIKLWEAL